MSEPTNTTHPVKALFAAIDARDAEAFAGFLADNVVFRFGNAETVKGREGVILKGEDAAIGECLIFADTSALYPPT